MKIKTNIKQLITTLLNSMKERKKWVLALSCLVVFCTTYLLILPAFTLDKEEASEQGGVDVPGVEQSVDADETTEDLAKVISEDNEKEESAEASSEDVEKEEVTKPAAEKPAKASKKETSKSDAKKKSADITLENDESDDFSVAVESKDAVLSEDMSVAVREIDKSDKKQKKEYDSLYNDALEAVQKAQEDEGQEKPSDFAFAKFYDISLMDGDTEVEPDAAVDVKISFSKDLQKELKVADPEKVHIVHFVVDKETGEVTPEVLDTKSTDITVENKKVTEAAFTTDSFSVFAVVYTVDFNKEVITASGDTYEVAVKYESDAKIPEGAELRVREILPEDEEYKAVQEKAGEELTDEMNSSIPAHPVMFDISIYDGETEIEPAPGSSVQVEVKLKKDSVTGLYSGDDSPLLINEKPVKADEQKLIQKLQVIHDVKDGSLEVVDVKQKDSQKSAELVGQFETESFSNWLLYLDEEFPNNEITVYQGDSITLRPYGEWYWKKNDEPANMQSWDWRFPGSEYNITMGNQTVPTNYSGGTRTDYGITKAVTKDGKYTFNGISRYDRELKEYYWFYDATLNQIGELYLHIGPENGDDVKTIKVKVIPKPAGDDGKPGTIQGTPNIKVNLFDYDNSSDSGHRGILDAGPSRTWNWNHWDYNWNSLNHNLSNGAYDETVNYNHNLKFLSSGSGGSNGVNGYTNQYAHQGLVQNTLPTTGQNAGFPRLANDYGGDSLKYLFDTSDTSWGNDNAVIAYPDVEGLFQLDDDGYYFFNSNKNYAYYDPSNGNKEITLYKHTYTQDTEGSSGVNGKPIGFFPFHDYDSTNDLHVNQETALNHHFGMSMQVEFVMPADKKNKGKDIIYEFSGDDDLWVYVDNQLVLDIGGIHQPVRGYINFTTGIVYVYRENNNVPEEIPFVKNLAADVPHTLDMFYLERGGCDSNLSVKFNLPLVLGEAHFTKHGEVMNADGSVGSHALKGAVFNLYRNMECTGTPLYTAESGEDGVVHFNDLALGTYYMKETVPEGYSDNLTLYRIEVLEDITKVDAYNKVYAQTGEAQWVEITDVLNEKEKTSVEVSKQWVNAGGSAWPEGIKSVQVGLYYSVNGGNPIELSEKKCNLTAAHPTYKFEDLFVKDNNNNDITYSVKEESVTLSDDTVTTPENAGISVSISGISNGTIVVTNTLKPDLPLLKVDATNHDTKLSGAEFIIEKLNDNNTWIDVTSNTLIKKHDGTDAERSQEGYFIIPQEGVVLTDLDNGEYQIVEKSSPDGYIIDDNPVLSFKVENGLIKRDNQTISNYEIENPPGIELPHTGGIGTTIIYIIGTMLVLGCSIYFIARKRIIN